METPEITPLDRQLADLLVRVAKVPSPELALATQLLTRYQAEGHICLPLRELTSSATAALGMTETLPDSATLLEKLRISGVVGAPGDFMPLILDHADRLYFERYWNYENQVADDVRCRLQAAPVVPAVGEQAKRLFTRESQLQKLAAIVAASSPLAVVSGAPGTGKTHTIVLICALLISLSVELEIALAAPTGKAAARLKEALAEARSHGMMPEDIASRLPEEATTIQRLLGSIGESHKFRHNREHPLPADVVIVDEASMIDLALLSRLLAAVHPTARLILVGDKDQLASVEAGSAFRDICTPGEELGVSKNQAQLFKSWTGETIRGSVFARATIHDRVVELRDNFRFQPGSAIARLSEAINRGDGGAATEVLQAGGDISWRLTPEPKRLEAALRERVCGRFAALRSFNDAAETLRQLNRFTVLCALRRGPFGSETINRIIERLLRETRGDDTGYFPGQPLMITRNDYNLGLFNGDIGIVVTKDETVRVYFPGQGGAIRSFSPARLPEHETAFALTVHKSQGSEFEEALLVLPDQDSPILTRELIYTAVTRVRGRVEIWTKKAIFAAAIGRTVRRNSGLREALWGKASASNR